jgi:hypothetical protein
MSSRKSTSAKSTAANSSMKLTVNGKDNSSTSTAVIAILYNILVLGYIMSLEDKKCACIRDWRHDFIKYYSISLIIWGILTIGFDLGTSKNELVVLLKNILMIASLYNIWCLYTYVGDLDKTNCRCAIDTQKDMHYFLYLWRYVLVGALLLALISIIMLTLKTM